MSLSSAKAGSIAKNSDQFDETLAFLRQQGWQVDLRFTKSADDARQVAREAVIQKADAVIAVGGDGTIHSVIQELAGSETALGVIPSGTFNVWAHETGIPLDSAGARDVLVNGRTRRIDLGRVNDHYFLLMAGIGFGGTVTYAVKKQSLKRWGIFGYLLTGIRLGLGYDSFRTELVIDGQVKSTRVLQIVVGNTQLYGSMLKFTWRARCDNGLLDVCMVRSPAKLERVAVILDFLLQRKQRRKWVSYHTCKYVEVHAQAGEFSGRWRTGGPNTCSIFHCPARAESDRTSGNARRSILAAMRSALLGNRQIIFLEASHRGKVKRVTE